MDNIYLTKEELAELAPFHRKNGYNEGMIYRHLAHLYKIFNESSTLEKEPMVDILINKGSVEHCVMPNNKIYVDNKFAGISIDYCRGYRTFYKTLQDSKIDYKTRLLMCRQFVETIKELYNIGVGYDDINLKNVMTNSANIKLIDMDGCLVRECTTDLEYKELKAGNQFNSTVLVLSYLYGINFEKMIYKHGKDSFNAILSIFCIDTELKQYIHALINNKSVDDIYVDQYLNGILEKNVEQDKNGFIKYYI